jgi:hypothetical protein
MSIRLALLRFRELHDEYKAGVFKSPEALKFYETERDSFLTAMLEAQQLTLRAGQAPRQTIRVNREERLVVMFGPRREGTLTIDIGMGGFAAMVGPFAAHIPCEFELGSPPDAITGRARTVISAKLPTGAYRTSFQITQLADDNRRKLETLVVDTALASITR